MRRELEIARYIEQVTRVDVFKNSRKRSNVEFRSLYNHILYNIMNRNLQWITDFYKENGKNYDHSTVIYSLKMFEVYKTYNTSIIPMLNDICVTHYESSDRIALVKTALPNMRTEDLIKVTEFVQKLLTNNIKNEEAKNTSVQFERIEA